jgi:hypothetical protein
VKAATRAFDDGARAAIKNAEERIDRNHASRMEAKDTLNEMIKNKMDEMEKATNALSAGSEPLSAENGNGTAFRSGRELRAMVLAALGADDWEARLGALSDVPPEKSLRPSSPL